MVHHARDRSRVPFVWIAAHRRVLCARVGAGDGTGFVAESVKTDGFNVVVDLEGEEFDLLVDEELEELGLLPAVPLSGTARRVLADDLKKE
jgi:hypothetical protein